MEAISACLRPRSQSVSRTSASALWGQHTARPSLWPSRNRELPSHSLKAAQVSSCSPHAFKTARRARTSSPKSVFRWFAFKGYYPGAYVLPPGFSVRRHQGVRFAASALARRTRLLGARKKYCPSSSRGRNTPTGGSVSCILSFTRTAPAKSLSTVRQCVP